jgi:serine protease
MPYTVDMDEQHSKRGGGRLLWALVIFAIVVLWWVFRPVSDPGVALALERSDAYRAAIEPGEILVDLKDDATPETIAKLEREVGVRLVLVDDTAKGTKLYRAQVRPRDREVTIDRLLLRPEVEIAEPDFHMMLTPEEDESQERAPRVAPDHEGFPNDPKYKFQWHLNQIGMPKAWKLADGNGVIVAVLDTGVGYEDHKKFHELPDLKGITYVDPYDFVSNDRHANDDHGHGSHVTGTIAQVTHNGIGVAGVARNVRIMPLKVLSASGSGSVAGIANAIRYAADHGAKVINMSLGGAFPSAVLKKAVAYAHGKGVVVVCAAGNESRGRVGYPAAYPGAIAVSATQFDEAITFYSNWGKDIDIAAPGGNTRIDQNGDGMPDGVLQNTIALGDPTKDDYFVYMGTSMASPHVAGVAALVVGEGITDPDRVEQILKASARKPENQSYNSQKYGAGIVDAPAAVLAARSSTGGYQFGLGLLMAGALAVSLRRRGLLGVKLGASYVVGVLVGASGLFFLPHLAPGLSSLPVVHALTLGVPSWDLAVLGPAGHGNALFFSVLAPLALLVVGYGVPRARGLIAGVAIGVAAHLAFFAAVPTAMMNVPELFGTSAVWLFGNALACIGLARLALRR